MIEINLLPGAGKKRGAKRAGGASVDFAALTKRLSGAVNDKYLAAAAACVIASAGTVGVLFTSQQKTEADLAERQRKAVQDSSHFAAVVVDKVRFEAKRDTLLRQLNIIRAIDDDRYIWPHIMDEVSRALPAFTWINNLRFSGAGQGTAGAGAAADTTKKGKKGKKVDTEVPRDSVQVRIMGETVDIQALTRFMKQLEASPFLGGVQLQKSEMVIDQGQQVTSFDLTMAYTRPDSAAVKRVALTATPE